MSSEVKSLRLVCIFMFRSSVVPVERASFVVLKENELKLRNIARVSGVVKI